MKWPLEASKPAEGNAVAIDFPLFSIWQECMVKDTRYLTFHVGTQAETKPEAPSLWLLYMVLGGTMKSAKAEKTSTVLYTYKP